MDGTAQRGPHHVPTQSLAHPSQVSKRSKGPFLLVGIDCAVDPRNVGLARATLHHGRITLHELHERVDVAQIATRVEVWRKEIPLALIALDAPLGWPTPLGQALYQHRAGATLPANANMLFRRRCDDVVAAALRKRPLDVGADRIARTAHAALRLLTEIREQSGLPVPVAWTPGPPTESIALEVYPGGTLKSLGHRSSGYKGAGREMERQEICDHLRTYLTFDAALEAQMRQSDHLLDAAICALAAADFVQENMILPPDDDDVRKEGWIWVRSPPSTDHARECPGCAYRS